DRSARVKHVIDEHHIPSFDQKIHFVVIGSQHPLAPPEIIAVKCDVEMAFQNAESYLFFSNKLDDVLEQHGAPRLNAYQANLFVFPEILDELLLQSPKGQVKPGRRHYFTSFLHRNVKIGKRYLYVRTNRPFCHEFFFWIFAHESRNATD